MLTSIFMFMMMKNSMSILNIDIGVTNIKQSMLGWYVIITKGWIDYWKSNIYNYVDKCQG